MKVALTMAAVAAAGMFAAGDRQLPTPSQMPSPAGLSESVFPTPPIAVAPLDLPMPIESFDQPSNTGSCGCGGASQAEGQPSDEDWDIDGCSAGSDDDDIDIPPGIPDRQIFSIGLPFASSSTSLSR